MAVWVDKRIKNQIVSSHASEVAPYCAVRCQAGQAGCLVSKTAEEACIIRKNSPGLRFCKQMIHIWGGAFLEYFCSEQIISGCIFFYYEASVCHPSLSLSAFIHHCEGKRILVKAHYCCEAVFWILIESCLHPNKLS